MSINQQCVKLEPLLFESHGVAETNFFPPKYPGLCFPTVKFMHFHHVYWIVVLWGCEFLWCGICSHL